MDDELIHIRVGKKIKKEMQALIAQGMFTNQSEIAREAIRDLLIKYKSYQQQENPRQGLPKNPEETKNQKKYVLKKR